MRSWIRWMVPAVAAAVCLNVVAFAQGIGQDEKDKIRAAMPEKPRVEPQQARRMLVFSLCKAYVHSSIPYWEEALRVMAEKTGAFDADFSTDMGVFTADNLKRYDAVCLNNTTHLEFTPEQRQALMEFLKGGKGLVGIHAATDNFYKWPEMQQIMGGTFTGHPWTWEGTWAFKIDDPDHPLTAAFGGKGFKISDEIYRTDPPLYERSRQRVLLSLDMSDAATAAKREKPEDDDVGVTWIKTVGDGRMFYSCLGHNHHLTWTSFVLQHYLDGIQWAMGDLEADATPAPAGAGALGARGEQIDALLKTIAEYDYGDSREPLTQLTELTRDLTDKPAAMRAVERKFLDFLKSDASMAGKQFICRRLSIIGSEASAETLAAMLADPETADMARYALELIPGEAVDEALRRVLDEADDKAKVGILSTLGLRGDAKSAAAIAPYATHADEEVAAAAITALGQIATPEATKALSEAKDKLEGDAQMLVLDALLNCADSLDMDGKTAEALAIYKDIFESNVPSVIRSAALRGMVFCAGDQAGSIIVDVIRKGGPEMTAVAVGLLNQIRDDAEIKAVAEQVSELPAAGQVQLITALGNRGHEAAYPAVAAATESDNDEVRIAAYKALASLGKAETAALLAERAAAARGTEKLVIRETLYMIRDPQMDAAILSGIPQAEPAARVELILSVSERNLKGAVPVLLKTAQDEDRTVRAASWRVLRDVAEVEHLPELIALLKSAEGPTERAGAEKAIGAVTAQMEPGKAVDALVAAMDDAAAEAKASLISLLANFGGPKAFAVVESALKSGDAALRDAAVRSLANFPDALPAETLLDVAKNADSNVHQILALRGYVRMIGLAKSSTDQMVQMCRNAMEIAERPTEQKMVLSAAGRIPDEAAIEFVGQYAANAALKAEAQAAVDSVKNLLDTMTFLSDEATLTAKQATIVGAGAVYEEGERDCIGSWQDEKTIARWNMVVKNPGTYNVVVVQSMADEAGSTYAIDFGGRKVQGEVKATGDWNTFEPVSVGSVELHRAGLYTVEFIPTSRKGQQVVNLRAIELKRSTDAGSPVHLTGADFSAWREPTGTWKLCGNVHTDPQNARLLAGEPGAGCLLNGADGRTVYLFSKPEFGDVKAHVEFMVPEGSNSGVYFQGRYEIQVFDSWGVEKPQHSDCGGIYQRWKDEKGYDGIPPHVNASTRPGTWQTFDVVFRAPRFDASGRKVANARFEKVVHNGRVVHENAECTGPTRAAQYEDEKPLGPLVLQGDHGPVAYRNIWVVPLD